MGLFNNKRSVLLVAALALLLNHFNNIRGLFQTPSSPERLYQMLGLPRTADANDIDAAYNRLYHPLLSSMEKEPMFSTKEKLIDMQHAYATLSDERRRRNYDTFHLDELQAAAQTAKKKMVSEGYLSFQVDVQDLHVDPDREHSEAIISLTSQSFGELVLESDDVWVIQLYTKMSVDSHELVETWDAVAQQLDGVAKVGRLEIGQLPWSVLLAEKTLFNPKQPRFVSGLPEVVMFTPTCRHVDCVIRYRGLKTVEALVDWVTTSVLKLPRIPYYNSKTLMKEVIQGAGPHKVKVLVFSNTGERALPYIRQAAQKHWEHTQFAMVLWQEQNAAFWESRVGVTSAPALVFVKDPGLKPVIYQGALKSSQVENLMEEHKTFVLPQLRSVSANALGCDARGSSMAGNGTTTWYCVIVVGRTGPRLTEMRGVMRGVLENLKSATEAPQHMLAAEALRSQRLSLSWLDGEKQQDFCYFYLHSPTMFEACGPSRYGDVEDVPKIFLIRYQRKALTSEEQERQEQEKALRAASMWASLLTHDNENGASQLVSKYNGSIETGAIVEWVSQMVYEGDSYELPSFRGNTPAFIPEEKLPFWARTKENVVNGPARGIQNIQWFMNQAFSWVTRRVTQI